MTVTQTQIRSFRRKIFSWWVKNRRDLPWRRTRDPYRIAVSEIMLQQTGVARVIPVYREFIRRYPSAERLAAASPADILRLWKGMGYNRRALYLYKMAGIIVSEYNGKFPQSEKELTKLPGLGTYTARALLVFAFNRNTGCVDTNIRKIITHFFFRDSVQKESVIQALADRLVPRGKSWEWHQALMDYGALEMTSYRYPEKPRKPAVPFKKSDRFFRGRIIDAVRDGPRDTEELGNEFFRLYGIDKKKLEVIIGGLIRDQLLVRLKTTICLPR